MAHTRGQRMVLLALNKSLRDQMQKWKSQKSSCQKRKFNEDDDYIPPHRSLGKENLPVKEKQLSPHSNVRRWLHSNSQVYSKLFLGDFGVQFCCHWLSNWHRCSWAAETREKWAGQSHVSPFPSLPISPVLPPSFPSFLSLPPFPLPSFPLEVEPLKSS